MRTSRSDGRKQKGGFSFESPPSTIRFSEDLFRRTDYSNAIPESFGIRGQARASVLFPLSHTLQELPHCLPEPRCQVSRRPLLSLFSGRLLFR
jgi:hypothetical protein